MEKNEQLKDAQYMQTLNIQRESQFRQYTQNKIDQYQSKHYKTSTLSKQQRRTLNST